MSPFLLWALFFLAGLVDVAVGAGRAATRGTRPWLPLAVGWLGVTLSQCLAIRAATIRAAVALALLAPLGVAALAAEAEMRRGCSLRELETTAREFLSAYGGLMQLTAERFVLPTLEPKLHRLRETLIHGIGFEVIRGIPVHRLSEELASTMFCGLGIHLGSPRSQNAKGDLLGHVRDVGADSKDPNVRIYQTHERQTFHTDSSDVVGLLCLNEAREGGNSLLVSAVSMYNVLRNERPDLLAYLFDEIATDRRGEVPPGEKPYFTIPVFNWHAGALTVMYQRQYIDSAQRFPDAPRLTPGHVEALDMFDRLANDPLLNFTMRLEPGDMQFVYNHSLLHDRTAFVDWPEPERRRHLLRLWLAIPGDRPLPPCFAQRYGSIEIGNRGGIIVRPATVGA